MEENLSLNKDEFNKIDIQKILVGLIVIDDLYKIVKINKKMLCMFE